MYYNQLYALLFYVGKYAVTKLVVVGRSGDPLCGFGCVYASFFTNEQDQRISPRTDGEGTSRAYKLLQDFIACGRIYLVNREKSFIQ